MPEKLVTTVNKSDTSITREETIDIEEQQPTDEIHLDAAAKFLSQHKELETSHIDLDKLRHKVDYNVVSVLCALFILAFLDKAIYNVSYLLVHIRNKIY
jgi:hypothetical protein